MSENMVELKQASSVESFKKHQEELSKGQLIKLPSGLVVRVRRFSVATALKEKAIPKHLLGIVMQQMQGDINIANENDMAKSIEAMDWMIAKLVIEPEVVLSDANDNQITPDYFEDADRGALYTYLMAGSEELQKFRQ